MPEIPAAQPDSPLDADRGLHGHVSRQSSSTSLREVWRVVARRRRLVAGVVGGLLLLCLLYCLITPNQYEASARVALRTSPTSSLSLEAQEPQISASVLSAPVQLETLADVFRSDELAWRVITELKLYKAPAFMGNFAHRFPAFLTDAPAADSPDYAGARDYLLDRFHRRLRVQSMPRTLLIQIRFRSKDAALSAAVVNALIRAYGEQESELRVQATVQASDWLVGQLKELKSRVDRDQLRLTAFQNAHGILSTPETLANGQAGDTQHTPGLLEIDELGRELVTATTDRILREAEYKAASKGDPELAIAADPRLQAEYGSFATALLQQIHAQRSALEVELSQLSMEHGQSFPRVVEIRGELEDLDRQKQAEDTKLVARFQSAWQTAADREQLVRKSLDEHTAEGMKLNQAATEYEAMRQEATRSHELYMQLQEKVEEAGLAAGIRGSSISVVDPARQPVKPVAPDLPLYLAITLFVSLWLALGGALLLESMGTPVRRTVVMLMIAVVAGGLGGLAHGQAPTPNLDGLPTGVARIPLTVENKSVPNAKDAPAVWKDATGTSQAGLPGQATGLAAAPMAVAIGPGDLLDVVEFRTPEFHSGVRVSAAGTVTLPMIGDVQVNGMDEREAAHAIEAALVAKDMLLHPRVSVLVTAYAGEDVSVLGEVARPGVYAYTVHHRLLDLISSASGLTPNAGGLVSIFHRSEPDVPHAVVLDPSGTDTGADHNPELMAGDTVQVSRAGLVYVIGDVMRPGGFAVDPAQGLTVVQALTLAWGPTQNAATSRAMLIREQKGGRTLITLNLKRMLHGQEPDQPIHDHDILFVPDSMAKNMMNRTIESAIQSAVGVTIYAGLVYSDRF